MEKSACDTPAVGLWSLSGSFSIDLTSFDSFDTPQRSDLEDSVGPLENKIFGKILLIVYELSTFLGPLLLQIYTGGENGPDTVQLTAWEGDISHFDQ